jgi:putative oxidoreductase
MNNIIINQGKFVNFGIMFLRISIGIMMIVHGLPKMAGGEEKWKALGSSVKYFGIEGGYVYFGMFAGIIEVIGGFLLAIGLVNTIATILLLLPMLVAVVLKANTDGSFIAIAHPLKTAFVFIALFITGPGKYSVDNYLNKINHDK